MQPLFADAREIRLVEKKENNNNNNDTTMEKFQILKMIKFVIFENISSSLIYRIILII